MQYDLVFEGGGAKGMVFVGALQELERRGHTHGRLLGTSAGAITATFAAAGFAVAEMLDALKEKDENGPIFKQFLGRPRPLTPAEAAKSATLEALEQLDIRFLPASVEERIDRLILRLMTQSEMAHIFSFIERGGWYSADAFLDWARAKLDQATPDGRSRNLSRHTFAEFHQATGRELSLVAADTTDHRMLVLNHRTAPRLPVVWGVRMSMSLPLLWQEVIWQPEWGTYLDRPLAGHRIVDGGLLSNFPIELFLSNDPHVQSLMGPKTSQGVLGLLIDESLAVAGSETDMVPPSPNHPSQVLADWAPAMRILGLIDTATQAHDKMVIDAFEQFVCRLPAQGYQTTEFDMTDARRDRLIAAGRAAMDHFFRAQETEGMKGPDIFAMERALKRADRMAGRILQ
jgi:predicted acylesterase/phospholipase RssA